jgi:hypothetical protein
MKLSRHIRGFKLVEVMISMSVISAVGLVVYSLLNINTVLGAKNTAVNTAHQQARVAMLQMVQDLRSAVSLPQLVNTDGVTPWTSPTPAPGIAFQHWSSRIVSGRSVSNGGPHKITDDVDADDDEIEIILTPDPTAPGLVAAPQVGQRLIVPTHQIEDTIVNVDAKGSGRYEITLAHDIGDLDQNGTLSDFEEKKDRSIRGTDSNVGDVVCFITDRCAYTVVNSGTTADPNYVLRWKKPATGSTFSVMGTDITNPTPFGIPTTPTGALYHRSVAAIDLSTADSDYKNRGFKAANVLLNGQIPMRARLTTYQ